MTTFIHSDTGAVTVDWVVLTAALVGLGLATMGVVSQGVETAAQGTKDTLMADGIIKTSFNTFSMPSALAAYIELNTAYGAGLSEAEMIAGFNTYRLGPIQGKSDADLLASQDHYTTIAATTALRAETLAGWTGSAEDVAWLEAEYGLDVDNVPSYAVNAMVANFGLDPDAPETAAWAAAYDDGKIDSCAAGISNCSPQYMLQVQEQNAHGGAQLWMDEIAARDL